MILETFGVLSSCLTEQAMWVCFLNLRIFKGVRNGYNYERQLFVASQGEKLLAKIKAC